jgi:ABC-2 type transport system ATP-binding protein
MTSRESIVQVHNLCKAYGEKRALANVSLDVKRGEIVGLLGANGAGKTTLIHILLGLLKPTAGTVQIFGKDLERHRISILERCNFSSAYIHLPHNLKVWENLLVFAKLYQVKNARKKIDHLLELFEVAHLRDSRTGYLSSGEQTRVNLCKALINDPELLLLDEPTASLDPDIADKVRKLIKRVQEEQNMTILHTSHNMRDVEELCDRILFLHKGNIIAEGSPQQIMDRFQQESLEDVFISIARGGDVVGEEKDELPSC